MGVTITATVETSSTVPAHKIYKGYLLCKDYLIPQVVTPLGITVTSTIQEGNGRVGTINYVTLNESSGSKWMKTRIDEIDVNAKTYTYTIIEGDIMLGKLESIINKFKVEETEGGCVVKTTTVFTPVAGGEVPEGYVKDNNQRRAHF